MKKINQFVAFVMVLALVLIPTEISAHSGRTDGAGGHHDYNNVSGLGSYHYHNGYGPHLHPNGVCPYETPTVTVKKRVINKTLKKAQRRLNKLGYNCGAPDVIMGSKTRKAIKRFQRKKHLKVTGKLNKATKRKLKLLS